MMRGALRTPGLRAWLGKSLAVITVTGARTNKRYTTPVNYMRRGNDYVVTSQRTRVWWRNIARRPDVELLVGGTTIEGRAEIADGESPRSIIQECVSAEPKVAKFYKLGIDETGSIDQSSLDEFLGHAVVIVIRPTS